MDINDGELSQIAEVDRREEFSTLCSVKCSLSYLIANGR